MKIINKITALIIRGYKKSFDPTGRDNRLQYVSIVLFQTMLFLCYDYFFIGGTNEGDSNEGDSSEIAFSVLLFYCFRCSQAVSADFMMPDTQPSYGCLFPFLSCLFVSF